jgi:hypothetical protein
MTETTVSDLARAGRFGREKLDERHGHKRPLKIR